MANRNQQTGDPMTATALELELEIPAGMRTCPVCDGVGTMPIPGNKRETCEGCGGAKLVKAPPSNADIRQAHQLAAALGTYRDAVRRRAAWLEGWRANTPKAEQELIDAETVAQNALLELLRTVLQPAIAEAFVMDVEHRTRAIDSMPTPGHGPEASLSGLEPVRATR